MADEPDDDDLGEIEVEDFSDSEYVEVEGAMIIAPRGWGWFADTVDAAAIRVNMAKGGGIDVLHSDDGIRWRWDDVTKFKGGAKVVEIAAKQGK